MTKDTVWPAPRLVLIISLVLFVLGSLVMLYTKFPPFMDEAIYLDMTYRLSDGLGLSSSLFRDFIPQVEQTAHWYPPVYFLSLAPLILIFGQSLLVMRLFSLLMAVVALILIYQIAKKIFGQAWVGVIAVWLLIMDHYFQVGAMVGRMELLTICFGCGAVLLHLHFLENKQWKPNLLSGACLALAVLTHPTGIIFGLPIVGNLWLQSGLSGREKLSQLAVFVGPVVFGLGLWLVSFLPDLNNFLVQNLLQAHRKQFGEVFVNLIFKFLPNQRVVLAGYLISNTVYLVRKMVNHQLPSAKHRFLFLLVLSSSILPIMLKEMWYIIYIPLIGALVVADNAIWLWKKEPLFLIGLVMVFVIPNSFLYFDALEATGTHRGEYTHFAQQIAQVLPTGAKVMLSSLPDPYFYLVQNRSDLDLRETPNSPPLEPIDTQVYNTILNDVDYVVLSYTHNRHLGQYFETNLASVVFEQAGADSYPVQVIKLKPVLDRQPVTALEAETWQYPTLAF